MDDEDSSSTTARSLHETKLYVDVKPTQWPIVYTSEYNIGFLGLERLHPFDSGKWGKIIHFLKDAKMVSDDTIVQPCEASRQDLLVVHTEDYLNSLKLSNIVEGISEWSINVAGITEVPPVAMLPNCIVQRKVLRPFRFHTGGTILAGKLAMERGWAVNVGGGFHHCSADHGGGFCAYADITLSIKFLLERVQGVSKVMIIDLDAHQGNGHERDFMNDSRVFIMDVYNRNIYPHDGFAKRAIKKRIELESHTEDEEYLNLVRRHIDGSLNQFTPDVVVYNAGTDILQGDPLGNLNISPAGIVERDQIVFQKVRTRDIPILMVTSGGYLRSNARIIADSLLNLRTLGLISCDEAEQTVRAELSRFGLSRSHSEGGLFSKLRRSLPRSATQDLGSPVDSPSAVGEPAPSNSSLPAPPSPQP